jgi:transcriptional regulator, araC family
MKKLVYHSIPLKYDYMLDKEPTARERQNEYYLHMHNDFEILYFFDGNAEYAIENVIYPLKKNSLLFIKPMAYHGIHILSDVPYERSVLNFSKQALNDKQKKIVDNIGAYYHVADNSPLRNVFLMLKDLEPVFNRDEFNLFKESSLSTIISILKYSESCPPTDFSNTNKTLDQIINYINVNPHKNLNSDIISQLFFVSKSWLNQSFKRSMQVSLKHYINQKKILFAQSKILDGASIKDVVELCNYDNYSTFYRQYVGFLHHEPAYDKELYANSQK